MKVIADLMKQIETRDWIIGDRNEHYWVQQDDMSVEDGLWVEVMKLKNMLAICVSVVFVPVAVLVVSQMTQVDVATKVCTMGGLNIYSTITSSDGQCPYVPSA